MCATSLATRIRDAGSHRGWTINERRLANPPPAAGPAISRRLSRAEERRDNGERRPSTRVFVGLANSNDTAPIRGRVLRECRVVACRPRLAEHGSARGHRLKVCINQPRDSRSWPLAAVCVRCVNGPTEFARPQHAPWNPSTTSPRSRCSQEAWDRPGSSGTRKRQRRGTGREAMGCQHPISSAPNERAGRKAGMRGPLPSYRITLEALTPLCLVSHPLARRPQLVSRW